MGRVFRIVAMAVVVVTTSLLALQLKDPRNFLAWPRQQGFVATVPENQPETPAPPLSSLRALDTETARPSPGAALEAEIARQGGSEFPILVPLGFGDTPALVGASRMRLRLLEGGYYVVFQSATMEITIIGSRMVYHDDGTAPTDVAAPYQMPFEDPGAIPAGGAIAFGHFGADYSVAFDCVNTAPGQKRNCITRDAAEHFVASLVAGTPTRLAVPPYVSS